MARSFPNVSVPGSFRFRRQKYIDESHLKKHALDLEGHGQSQIQGHPFSQVGLAGENHHFVVLVIFTSTFFSARYSAGTHTDIAITADGVEEMCVNQTHCFIEQSHTVYLLKVYF